MKSVKLPLTDSIHRFVTSQIGDRTSYASAEEYICDLIRREKERKARADLEGLLLAGMNSGTPLPVTASWKDDIRRLAKQRRTRRNGSARTRR